MSKTKRQVRSLLNKLPDDCTLEDVQYHLYVIQKVENSIREVERGEVYTQEEVEAYFEKWFRESSGHGRRAKTSGRSPSTSAKTRPRLRKAS